MPPTISDRLTDLFSSSKIISYSSGDIILNAGDTPTAVFFLQEGYIKMNSVFDDGRELTLNIFKPGTYFPMTWAISDIENTYFFYALTPVKLRKISKIDFSKFLSANPDILWDFSSRLLVGLNGLLNNVQHLLSGNSYHRVVSAILLSARRFGKTSDSGQIVIQVPLTHQDFADIAGITRETASLCIGKMISKGLIEHRYRHTTILSPSLLEKESRIGMGNDLISSL